MIILYGVAGALGYTAGVTSKVGPKGQVVIPKPIRDNLGIRPGDRVVIGQDGSDVRISKAVTAGDLRGSLPPSEIDPLAVVMDERRRDREREELEHRR